MDQLNSQIHLSVACQVFAEALHISKGHDFQIVHLLWIFLCVLCLAFLEQWEQICFCNGLLVAKGLKIQCKCSS